MNGFYTHLITAPASAHVRVCTLWRGRVGGRQGGRAPQQQQKRPPRSAALPVRQQLSLFCARGDRRDELGSAVRCDATTPHCYRHTHAHSRTHARVRFGVRAHSHTRQSNQPASHSYEYENCNDQNTLLTTREFARARGTRRHGQTVRGQSNPHTH